MSTSTPELQHPAASVSTAGVEGGATDAEVIERAAVARRWLEVLLDRVTGTGLLEPQLLGELAEFAGGEALAAARAYEQLLRARWLGEDGPASTCKYECALRDLWHCPLDAPFERAVEELTGAGYRPYQDRVEERVAGETRCVCGESCSYFALRRGGVIRAWAVCLACWHWLDL